MRALLALGRVFGAVASPRGGEMQTPRVDGVPEVAIVRSADYAFDYWHADSTAAPIPPIVTAAVMRERPTCGGDTLWASTRRAYETLAAPLQHLVEPLSAVHGRGAGRLQEHPVVATNRSNGRRHLFVNRDWTVGVSGWPRHQSDGLLALLFDHIERPEHTVRWACSLCDRRGRILDGAHQPLLVGSSLWSSRRPARSTAPIPVR